MRTIMLAVTLFLLAAPVMAADISCVAGWTADQQRDSIAKLEKSGFPPLKFAKREIDTTVWVKELSRLGARPVCYGALIRGEIKKGDLARLKAFMADGNVVSALYLDSPGGDLDEAMAIGEVVRAEMLSTAAPIAGSKEFVFEIPDAKICHGPDCTCSSACFFIWAAGVDRIGEVLGLHRPTFKGDYQGSAATAQGQYGKAIANARAYLTRMEVPGRYIDIIIGVESRSIKFLSSLEGTGDIRGEVPSTAEWVDLRCERMTPEEDKDLMKVHMQVNQPTSGYGKYLKEKWSGTVGCRWMALNVERINARRP
jgi:hypothetical protein